MEFFKHNLFDYEQNNALSIVKGCLKAHLQFWKDICSLLWILDTIRLGYVIPFSHLPSSVHLSNNKSALTNANFVSEAISDLLLVSLFIVLDYLM
jgi:hypothetical protein